MNSKWEEIVEEMISVLVRQDEPKLSSYYDLGGQQAHFFCGDDNTWKVSLISLRVLKGVNLNSFGLENLTKAIESEAKKIKAKKGLTTWDMLG